MPANVRMYDCGFGDCFRISHNLPVNVATNASPHLYVDFGSYSHRHLSLPVQYQRIVNDMPDACDFLLTHYHHDHYAGTVFMMRNCRNQFRNVYIPDVWGIANSVRTVYLLLLRGLLSKSVLRRGLSLISFLAGICQASGRIYFVRRGSVIHPQYTALWPSDELISRKSADLHAFLRDTQDDYADFAQLAEIAAELCNIMQDIPLTANARERQDSIVLLERLENRYRELAQDLVVPNALRYKLSAFENEISIVFHSVGADQNLLFAGDVETDAWNYITANTDGQYPLADHYNVIKIPHHGTAPHYYDFTNLSRPDTTFLIPNGNIRRPDWFISDNYSANVNGIGCHVVCANNDACNAVNVHGNCPCRNHRLVYPNLFQDV